MEINWDRKFIGIYVYFKGKKPKMIGYLHNRVYINFFLFFPGMVRQSARGYLFKKKKSARGYGCGSEARLALLDGGLELPLRRRPRRRHDHVLPRGWRAAGPLAVGVQLVDAVGLLVQAAHSLQAADLFGIHQQAAPAVLPSYQLHHRIGFQQTWL